MMARAARDLSQKARVHDNGEAELELMVFPVLHVLGTHNKQTFQLVFH